MTTESPEKTWDEMTVTERKIVIAKDVLAQVKAGVYQARRGYAFIAGKPIDGYAKTMPEFVPRPMSEHFDEPVTKGEVKQLAQTCNVCARGAMLLSRIDKFNTLTWSQLVNAECFVSRTATAEGLRGAFTWMELDEIEDAFEAGLGTAFGRILDANDRLAAIMQYIIEHNGEFSRFDEEWVKQYLHDLLTKPAEEFDASCAS